MKIQYCSDLHLEFWKDYAPKLKIHDDTDVLILAGDISPYIRQLEELFIYINNNFKVKTFFISGNHEYYKAEIHAKNAEMEEVCKEHDIVFLNDSTYNYAGVLFFGSTLWTDFELYGEMSLNNIAMENIRKTINDFKLITIKTENDEYVLNPAGAITLNQIAKFKLDKFLEKKGRKVVITHHSPISMNVHPKYQFSVLNPAFNNAWEDYVSKSGVKLWVHGHTHYTTDDMVGETFVSSCQLGYPRENYFPGETEYFEPKHFIIE